MKILTGHVSPETAYIVEDYPYGFRLRCRMRVWLETNKNGTRMVTQTTNPKAVARAAPAPSSAPDLGEVLVPVSGPVWNKPKASTYSTIGVLYLDDEEHVQRATLTAYDFSKAEAFAAQWAEGLTDRDRSLLRMIVARHNLREGRAASASPALDGAGEVGLAATDEDVSEGVS